MVAGEPTRPPCWAAWPLGDCFHAWYSSQSEVVPGSISLWDEYLKWRTGDEAKKMLANQRQLIGSPSTLRERLRKFQESHIDQVILINQTGKNTHEHIVESLELFAHEVMPEFHAGEPEQQAWRKSVLAGETQLEEIDPSRMTPVSLQSPKWKEQKDAAKSR